LCVKFAQENELGVYFSKHKEVIYMELKELVLEVEELEEKIAPTGVSGGRP
jgi:hypothetical protein